MAIGRNSIQLGEAAWRPQVETSAVPSRLLRRLCLLLLAVWCLIVGAVLTVGPWLNLWQHNYFASLTPLWNSPYLRGAVTGLGLVNLSLSLSEMKRALRRERVTHPLR